MRRCGPSEAIVIYHAKSVARSTRGIAVVINKKSNNVLQPTAEHKRWGPISAI